MRIKLARSYGIDVAQLHLTSSYRIRAQTAFLASLLSPPQVSGGGAQYYDATMTVQESI